MIGSLCSGILGLERGLSAAGLGAPGFVAEIDPFCSALIQQRSELLNVGSVTGDAWRLTPRPSVVAAGFPCQPSSTAGRRRGTSDDRWIFPAIAEILAFHRPVWIVLENVPGLLSVNAGKAFGEIANVLDRLRFDFAWKLLGAWQVGAPHRRDRLFLVARDRQAAFRLEPEREPYRPAFPPGPHDAEGWAAWRGPSPVVPPGLPLRGARLRALGNAVVELVAFEIGRSCRRIEESGFPDGDPVGRLVDGRLACQGALPWGDGAEPWPRSGVCRSGRVEALGSTEREARPEVWTDAYPTPTAERFGSSQNGVNRTRPSAGTPSLDSWAGTWATPVASDARGRDNGRRSATGGEPRSLRHDTRDWPTPIVSDSRGPQSGATAQGSPPLSEVARRWPTPTARDGAHGIGFEGQLPNAATLWPTASTSDARSSRRHGYMLDGHDGTTLTDAALALAGLGPAEHRPEERASAPRGVLNPDFVEALMGFPVGYTDPLRIV